MNMILGNTGTFKSSILAVFFAMFLMTPGAGFSADEHGHESGGQSTLQPADNWAPRITVDQLQGKILRGEKIIILDVRTKGSYDSTKYTIKNAIRIEPQDVRAKAAAELPKGYEIVTFCT